MIPSTTKYLVRARLNADGIVEKPDVVGAIFGQTEGLLGDELDLRDLQKSGRIGRIEVDVHSKQGKSEGRDPDPIEPGPGRDRHLGLGTGDHRPGRARARPRSPSSRIEDVRVVKRAKIIDRARELLTELIKQSKTSGVDLTESVRQSVQVEEIIYYGKDRLPAGPNVAGLGRHHRGGRTLRCAQPAEVRHQERHRGRGDQHPQDHHGAVQGARHHRLRGRGQGRRAHPQGTVPGGRGRLRGPCARAPTRSRS